MATTNEAGSSVFRVLTSLINVPLLGEAITEIVDFRGKLKQKRLNQFTELLENYFTNHEGIKLESFQTEEFSDLFESVLRRVVLTKSAEKMRMYKDILVNQIENPSQDTGDAEIYLDLIAELTETELKILYDFHWLYKHNESSFTQLIALELRQDALEEIKIGTEQVYRNQLHEIYNHVSEFRKQIAFWAKQIDHKRFNIEEQQYLFYKQRLFSKGLLIDSGVGSIGTRAFEFMLITRFGIQFIDFIISE